MFRIVIPARAGSSRFPGKALADLKGRPMVRWVYEKALAAGADEVLIATDDEAIAAATRAFGAEVRLTSPKHASGTDRIAEVAAIERWADSDIVVNVQGDEPLIPPRIIAQVAALLAHSPQAAIATLATPLDSPDAFVDPNIVKVVTDVGGRALYFSRAPIPFNRDEAGPSAREPVAGARRHVGLYAYRVSALRALSGWAPSALERCEKLEQLRALEHGLIIQVADALEIPGPDVNTPEDLRRVGALIG